MCGRYSVAPKTKGKSKAAKLLEQSIKEGYFNAAPSQKLPVITNAKPDAIQYFSWGLQPFWAKDAKSIKRSINARAETLTEKPSFRRWLRAESACLMYHKLSASQFKGISLARRQKEKEMMHQIHLCSSCWNVVLYCHFMGLKLC